MNMKYVWFRIILDNINNKMLSKVFGSRMARSALMSQTLQRQAGMMMNLPKRGVSLLINDQFLEED